MAQKDDSIRRLEEELKSHKQEFGKDKRTEYEDTIDDLESENSRYRKRYQEYRDSNTELEAEVKELQGKLYEKQQEGASLTTGYESFSAKLDYEIAQMNAAHRKDLKDDSARRFSEKGQECTARADEFELYRNLHADEMKRKDQECFNRVIRVQGYYARAVAEFKARCGVESWLYAKKPTKELEDAASTVLENSALKEQLAITADKNTELEKKVLEAEKKADKAEKDSAMKECGLLMDIGDKDKEVERAHETVKSFQDMLKGPKFDIKYITLTKLVLNSLKKTWAEDEKQLANYLIDVGQPLEFDQLYAISELKDKFQGDLKKALLDNIPIATMVFPKPRATGPNPYAEDDDA
jgi:hypothetical protein